MFYQETEFEHITDLKEDTYGIGTSVPVGLDIGYDVILQGDTLYDSKYKGSQVSVGFGFGIPLMPHICKTYTVVDHPELSHRPNCKMAVPTKQPMENLGIMDGYQPGFWWNSSLVC